MRKLLIALVPLMLLAPAAQASHCNALNFYSGFRLGVTSISWDPLGGVGCATGDDNTDLVLPGSSFGMVFSNVAARPLDGVALPDGSVSGSSLVVGGTTVPVTWTQGTRANGTPAGFWFTQQVSFAMERSVEPGFSARAHVCYAADQCIERTYRTATTI